MTYLPLTWDVSDLEEVAELLDGNPKLSREIADSGQERFRYYVESERGNEEFAANLLSSLQTVF